MGSESAHRPRTIARFFDVNLDDAKPSEIPIREEIVQPLLSKLKSQQMLILAGQLEDKKLYAEHLAWNLVDGSSQPIQVKQWCPALEPQDFSEPLRRFNSDTILLFPDVLPHHLGHDLRRLHQAVYRHDSEKRHYVIITTDSVPTDWGGGELEKLLWHETLRTEDIYPLDLLRRRLGFELQGCDALQSSGSDMDDLARKLRTPHRVRWFAELVKVQKLPIDSIWIDKIVSQLSGEGAEIQAWYNDLDSRLKVLALGLALLDGLLLDQVMAALHILVRDVWIHRISNFSHFTAADLPHLRAYFLGTSGGDRKEQIVTCRSAKHRQAILTTAWGWDRLAFTDALSVLARIATESGPFGSQAVLARDGQPNDGQAQEEPEGAAPGNQVADQQQGPICPAAADWLPPGLLPILFGSPEKVRQIQWIVAVRLSEIGKALGIRAVSNILVGQMAANQNPELLCRLAAHCVSATALALWWEPDSKSSDEKEARFFATLDNWYEMAFRRGCMGTRATLTMAVCYAARLYPPNRLDPRLLDLFETLCRDDADLVWELARYFMVPAVAALHLDLERVRTILRNELSLENKDPTRYGLAKGLAESFLIQPEVARPFIEQWYREGLRSLWSRRLSSAKKRLMIVVLTYGWIAADDLGGKDGKYLAETEIAKRLCRVTWMDGAVREWVVEALMIQLNRDPGKLIPVFGRVLKRLTSKERAKLAKELKANHIEELERQRNVWRLSDPDYKAPLTGVEKNLGRWLLERRWTVVGWIAMRTLLKISTLEHEVKRRERLWKREVIAKVEGEGIFVACLKNLVRGQDPIAWHYERRRRAEQREETLRKQRLSEPQLLISAFCQFATFWATLSAPKNRATVQRQFAGLLEYWQSSIAIQRNPRKWLARIFDRYKGHMDETSQMVNYLVRCVWLFRFRWPLVLVSSLLLASLAINLYAR